MVTFRASVGYPSPDTERPVAPDGVTRVTMLAHISGTRNGIDWPPVGGEIEVPASEAADLIRNYLARPAPEPVERAVADPEPSERAVVEQPVERAQPPEAHSARAGRTARSKGK